MKIIPEKNIERLIGATKVALENKNVYRQVREGIHLAGHSTTLQIYGEDAAQDFIETKWPELFDHLLTVADGKRSITWVSIPVSGKKAQSFFLKFMRTALPGCKISLSGCSMEINWGMLVLAG